MAVDEVVPDPSRPYYRVALDAVDGLTSWYITTDSACAALKFLRQYDHEGSSLMMNTVTVADRLSAGGLVDHDAEAIYKQLFDVAEIELTRILNAPESAPAPAKDDRHEPDHQPADQRDGGDADPADRSGDSER